jgi:hypothetical protein
VGPLEAQTFYVFSGWHMVRYAKVVAIHLLVAQVLGVTVPHSPPTAVKSCRYRLGDQTSKSYNEWGMINGMDDTFGFPSVVYLA